MKKYYRTQCLIATVITTISPMVLLAIDKIDKGSSSDSQFGNVPLLEEDKNLPADLYDRYSNLVSNAQLSSTDVIDSVIYTQIFIN